MAKVLVALSGGVDSAAAAALLKEQGHEVLAATMLLHGGGGREAGAAREAAEALGLPFRLFDWRTDFDRLVVEPFDAVYRAGGTPNPCVLCNKALKFGKLLEAALDLGCGFIATGHYARLERREGRVALLRAADEDKDQSYMLAGLSQDQLAHTLLPLGALRKAEVRALAARFGLTAQAGKKDSQDICFLPDGGYAAFLAARAPLQAGWFIGEDGGRIAPHKGYEAYTLGQRRGLGVAAGERVYVLAKPRPDVVLGREESLFSREVRLTELNWLRPAPEGPLRAQAKLRYTARPAPCTVTAAGEGAVLVFDEPQRAPTPGQAAALYDGDEVLGAGVIL